MKALGWGYSSTHFDLYTGSKLIPRPLFYYYYYYCWGLLLLLLLPPLRFPQARKFPILVLYNCCPFHSIPFPILTGS